MKWFLSLDVTVQAALIGVGGSALIAVISGLFRIAKKDIQVKRSLIPQ